MKRLGVDFLGLCAIALVGCAQVPKESVELSSTVGRDISAIQVSHLALINIYFDDKEAIINKWVDQVYAPSQITAVVGNPAIRTELEAAIKEAAAGQNQDRLIKRLDFVLTRIRKDVENTRTELLAPVKSAREDTLTKIQAAYNQVQLGNNIVTGYLSSVVKITDQQNALLAKAGLDDVRDKLSTDMVNLGDNLDKAITASPDKCHTVANVVQAVAKYTKKVTAPTTASCN